MPTYVYGCDACGHRFEQFQKFADEPIKVCPNCGEPVRRIFQPAGIVFKGSGWHITDYKRNGNNGSGGNNGNGNGNGDGENSKSGKSDAKPADGKAEAKPADGKADSTSSTSGDSNKPAQATS